MPENDFRNFAILAHIDHGKSTLADRFLELTGTIPASKMHEQYLDMMDLERERGITIKMQPVRMEYHAEIPNSNVQNDLKIENCKLKIQDSKFILNLIDTPGHMDFNYEVERSLAAVEGAILLIDATKGIQAQTLANLRLAREQNLTLIPVLNKMDMPAAQINEQKIRREIENLLEEKNILAISAKSGQGAKEVLDEIIRRIPAPVINETKPLRALIFDSSYDSYKGIIAYVRVFEGSIKKGEKISLLNVKKDAEAIEVGYFTPELSPQNELKAGEIGYIATGLKDSKLVRVGDTITKLKVKNEKLKIEPLHGYREPRPLVFANIFPSELKSFPQLHDSLSKLHLSDSSFHYETTSHPVLGRGFKVGFLGMLHLEIIFERLKREYDTKIILTSPTVVYKVIDQKNREIEIFSAQDLLSPEHVKEIKEPWVSLEILTPTQYSSKIYELLKQARAEFIETKNLTNEDVFLKYKAPLAEIIENFLDNLKSISQGYASFSYKLEEYRPIDLVKIEFAIVGEVKPSLSRLVPRQKADRIARDFLSRLKDNLPSQQFPQALQAKIGGKVIAREDIRAMRKDVTAPLYGGDYTRKKKLLQKQHKGKKRLLRDAHVDIPEEVYLGILKRK